MYGKRERTRLIPKKGHAQKESERGRVLLANVVTSVVSLLWSLDSSAM